MTLYESAKGATLPWFSLDAGTDTEHAPYDAVPQQSIDICLSCPYHADRCETCGDWNAQKRGRPKADVDLELLREMLTLKKCNRELCAIFGVSKRTLQNIKKQIV